MALRLAGRAVVAHTLTCECCMSHRKAYRLGKWLSDVNAMRKMPLTTRFAYLELLASGGSAVYYFVEQLTW